MSNIIPFNFENTEVRIIHENEEVLFCLKDVCEVLTISNHRRVLADILDEKGVRKTYTLTAGGRQELAFINEPNLYRVIFRSNKAEAKYFQDWVFNEVLPSIRKTGGYNINAVDFNDPSFLRSTLLTYTEKCLALETENKELKPKADALDLIATSDGMFSPTEAAKILQIRRKDLFAYLHLNGWTFRWHGNGKWTAYSDKVKSGDLFMKVTTFDGNDGVPKTVEDLKITPKGLAKLSKIFSKESV